MNNGISLHGTAIEINRHSVIIMGPSASGKSDLALRLVDRGAKLITDDLVNIIGNKDAPIAVQTSQHINSIEIRGVGIIPMECVNNIPLKLVVQLTNNYERTPSPLPLMGYGQYIIPCLKISAFEISAPIKIEQALINLDGLTNITNKS